VLGDGAPTLAQIRTLDVARAVARETLRAYPLAPVTFMGVAKQDLELDGFAIRKGWKGAGAIWPTLQDGATFADPTAFQPDRLADAAVAKLPANAYVPQGGGPADGHRCPGDTLTQVVMPGFLAWFAKHHDLAFPAQDVTPGPGGLGPLPRSGVRVTVSKRR
jgi:fatty-acid peroxygenase